MPKEQSRKEGKRGKRKKIMTPIQTQIPHTDADFPVHR